MYVRIHGSLLAIYHLFEKKTSPYRRNLKGQNFMNFMTENRLKKVNCELDNSDSLHYHSLGTLLKGFWKVQISLLLSYAFTTFHASLYGIIFLVRYQPPSYQGMDQL